MSPVAVHAARANIKAFAGIQYSLKGIQSTLKSMEKVEINLIENDKLRVIAEEEEELDRLAEERAEKPLSGASSKAAAGKIKRVKIRRKQIVYSVNCLVD